jgi:hypothetical protein
VRSVFQILQYALQKGKDKKRLQHPAHRVGVNRKLPVRCHRSREGGNSEASRGADHERREFRCASNSPHPYLSWHGIGQ